MIPVYEVSPWQRRAELESELAHFYPLDQDVAVYRDLVASCGAVSVELGIGAGRVAAVARPTVGVDSSLESLEVARERVGYPITLINADVREYGLEVPAALTYCPMNTVNLLSAGELEDVLANVRRNTAPKGVFAFDTFDWDSAVLAALYDAPGPFTLLMDRPTRSLREVMRVVDPQGLTVSIETLVEYRDPATGVVSDERYFEPYDFTFHPAARLITSARRTGWQVASCAYRLSADGGARRRIWQLRAVEEGNDD
jgi:SAM-dependent methyltransferase